MTKKARLANGRGLFIHIWVWGPGQCHLLSLTEHPPKGSVIPVVKSNGYYQPSFYYLPSSFQKTAFNWVGQKVCSIFLQDVIGNLNEFLVKPIKWYSFFFTLPK